MRKRSSTTKKKSSDKYELSNYENIYQLIAEKQWARLIALVHENAQQINFDPLFERAIRIFEDEFFKSDSLDTTNNKTLMGFYFLHAGNQYHLSKANYEIAVVEIIKKYDEEGKLESAFSLAEKFPDNVICQDIIQRYTKTLPIVKRHSQESRIRVTENKNVAPSDLTISLFKSPQEQDFFLALREAFPSYVVYPNVSINSTISFEKIREFITFQEGEFFFKSIIDFVVFDQHNNYKPVYFFELDSSFHDNDEQKRRDEQKDKIIALAGHQLYRIRRTSKNVDKSDFLHLIKELFR